MCVRSLLPLVAVLLAAMPSVAPAATLPDIKHVWIIVLENKDYADSFGPDTEAPYLARELTKQGKLLTNYYGTAHNSLGNYLTMISGQGVNPITQADCPQFQDMFPGVVGPDGQVVGSGCIFPKEALTIADQLETKGFTWKGYMEDMGNTPGTPATCRHPAIGDADDTQAARAGDQYATRHDPFVYFHSIIDDQARCDAHVVPLDRLPNDVKQASTTPNFGFITPDLCSDGHDASCADGGLGGLPAADVFLKKWVPIIVGSPGFAEHGLLVITWDEANLAPGSSDSCCGQPIGPNSPLPGILGTGGGRTGSVLLSPFVTPGSKSETPYNHYALLRSVEDLFGLDHLGYAAQAGLVPFGADIYERSGAPLTPPKPHCRVAKKGSLVSAIRLRPAAKGVLLTYRGRRKGTLRITVTHKNGRVEKLKTARRIKACRAYQVRLASDVVKATLKGGGRSTTVRRTKSLEHDPS